MNIRRIFPILLVAMLIGIASMYAPKQVHATVSYDWEFDRTFFYNTSRVTYAFSSLDSTTIYRWDLYTVDINSGALLQSVGFRTFTGGTTTSVEFGGASLDPFVDNSVLIPDGYQGPLAVVDSNGTILGRHFVVNEPTYPPNTATSDWYSSAGNTALYDKQVIGGMQTTGDCKNPVYAPLNLAGWQHTYFVCSVSTLDNSFAILHYQIDPSYVGDPTAAITFYQIPTSITALTIYLDDILAYQCSGATALTCDATNNGIAFMIVNTSGIGLPFVDNDRAVSSFTTGDNPLVASMSPGVYNYSRSNSGGWISDGESVWPVTNDPAGVEWSVTASNSQVSAGGIQQATTHAVTEEIWDSYHGAQSLIDGLQGVINSTVYTFETQHLFSYTTSASLSDSVNIQWINVASALNSGLATPTEMEFVTNAFYENVTVPTLSEKINVVMKNVGLDTDSGRAALLMILLFCGALGVAAFPGLRMNIYAHMVVWTGIGATYILGGYGTFLVNTIFTIMTICMWIFAIMMGQSMNANDGE